MEERVKVPDTCRQAAQNIMAELFKNSNASRDEDTFMDDFFRRTDNMIGDMKRIQEMQKNSSYPGKMSSGGAFLFWKTSRRRHRPFPSIRHSMTGKRTLKTWRRTMKTWKNSSLMVPNRGNLR